MQKCSMKTGTGSPRSHVAGATEIRLRQSRLPNGSNALAARSRMIEKNNRRRTVLRTGRWPPLPPKLGPSNVDFCRVCQALIYAQKCSVYVVSRLSNGTQTARFFLSIAVL